MATFGTIIEKSESNVEGILNSAILNESVPTNTIFFQLSSSFVLMRTPVNTGEKFFSVMVYSTLSTPEIKVCVSNINSFP